ncbi:MAG: hypothetical protein AAF467_13130 [Actinomycetota bacterium]
MVLKRTGEPIDRSGPVRLEDLGLDAKSLAVIAVADAVRAARGLRALGREPHPDLCALAEGDSDLIAAFVADNSPVRDEHSV